MRDRLEVSADARPHRIVGVDLWATFQHDTPCSRWKARISRNVPQPLPDPLEQLAHGAKYMLPDHLRRTKNVSVGCNKCFTFWSILVIETAWFVRFSL